MLCDASWPDSFGTGLGFLSRWHSAAFAGEACAPVHATNTYTRARALDASCACVCTAAALNTRVLLFQESVPLASSVYR